MNGIFFLFNGFYFYFLFKGVVVFVVVIFFFEDFMRNFSVFGLDKNDNKNIIINEFKVCFNF